MNKAPAQEATSRRERNKLDKVRRIREAALQLFLTKGYDEATTREIAARAGVGLGTVFVYAETKRDLLFLIVNDDLDEIARAAAAVVKPSRSMLANLLSITRAHYAVVATQPEIWRLALREMYFYASGVQAQRFLKIRERLIALFVRVFVEGLKAERSRADAELAGWMAFALFQIDMRRFLMRDDLDVDDAVRQAARQFRVLIRGARARPAAE